MRISIRSVPIECLEKLVSVELLDDESIDVVVADNGCPQSETIVALDALLHHLCAGDRERRVIEEALLVAFKTKQHQHQSWIDATAAEVADNDQQPAAILRSGPRAWAELHLCGLRGGSWNAEWWRGWVDALDFQGCPCEGHFRAFCVIDPPELSDPDFFGWGVRLHNSVNARIGRPILTPIQARELWSRKSL